MEHNRPIVLSIAGFDPSGGAGVLADIKTLEQHHCLGMAVVTGLTMQTENTFIGVNWVPLRDIMEQLVPLLDRYKISVVKIGIIENLEVLAALISRIRKQCPGIPVIWDPVIAASASGFRFITQADPLLLQQILPRLFLITPNIPEALLLSGADEQLQAGAELSAYCAVYLKGGHADNRGTDYLFTTDHVQSFAARDNTLAAKHGSGCILAAAIAARLALGDALADACTAAKIYIEKILSSNPSLLAYHYV